MKRRYCMSSIVLSLILGASAFAAEPVSETAPALTNTIEEAFTNGKVSGEIKYFYHHIEREVNKNTFANALGGSLKYSTDTNLPLFAAVEFYTSQPIFGRSDSQKGIALFEGDTDDQLTVISQAYVGWQNSHNRIIVGDFRLNTPMMNDDTTRIIPFSYQGVSYTNTDLQDVKIELNHIRKVRSMNSDEYLDKDIAKFGGTEIGDAGITMLGATYTGIAGLKLKSYYYYAPDLYSTFMAQGDYTYAVNDRDNVIAGIQYYNSGNPGEFAPSLTNNNGGPDINLIALQVGYSMAKWKNILGYSRNFGESGMIRGYGGLVQVYTTSMNANGRGNYQPETWSCKSSYSLPETRWGVTNLALGLTHTRTKEIEGKDFDALYLHLKQNFTKKDYLHVRFQTFDYKEKVGQEKPENYTAFRIILSHKF